MSSNQVHSRIVETIYRAIFVILLILPAFILVSIFIPYAQIKSFLDSLPRDGNLELYTLQFHQKIKFYFWIVFLASALFPILYWKARNRVIRRLEIERKNLSKYTGEERTAVRKFLAEENRLHVATLLIVIVLGVVIRIFYIFNQPIHHDESKTIFAFASESFAEVLTNYYVPNNHVFNSFLVKISILLFGNHVWSIRLPVFVAGVLVLPMAYAVSRILFGRNVALMATALCAISYPLVQYSSNARGYILVTFFFLCLMYLAEKLKTSDNRIAEHLFVLCAGFGAWTVPAMLYPFSIAMLWLLASRSARKKSELFKSAVRISILTGIFVLLVYSLLMLRMGPEALTSNEYVSPKSLNSLMGDFPETFKSMNKFVHSSVPTAIQVLLFSLVGVGIGLSFKSKPNALQLASISVIACIALILLQRRIAFVRVWLFLVPIYFFLVANGIALILERILNKDKVVQFTVAVITFVLIGISLPGTIRGFSNPAKFGDSCIPAPNVLEFLIPQLKQNSVIETASPCSGPIRYYLLSSNVSLQHFFWYDEDLSNAASLQKYAQIFVVVQEPCCDLEFFKYREPIKNYTRPMLIKNYLPVRIYKLQRLSSP